MWLPCYVCQGGRGRNGRSCVCRERPSQESRWLPVNSSSRIAGPGRVHPMALVRMVFVSQGGPCSPEELLAAGRVLGEAEPRQLSC